MFRRVSLTASLLPVFALMVGVAVVAAGPVKLARHPDYHAGRIAFSYLGDIWTAGEDGTAEEVTTLGKPRRASFGIGLGEGAGPARKRALGPPAALGFVFHQRSARYRGRTGR